MRTYKVSLALIFLLIHTLAISQRQGYTWHFGRNAGLNFNTSPVSVTTTGQTFSREGVATISDKTTGQLLFYTEGTTVWNRNHVVMPNGFALLGDYSSTQSAIVVPRPGNPNRYYLFTTALVNGMYYSEVDMTLAGGNGDIVASTKNTLLLNGTESSEKLIAVKHCNGVDYWVITHKLFSNSFVVYLVTAAGVQPGVTYNIGATLGDANAWTGVGYLKLSASGNRLAHVMGPSASGLLSNVELLNFDNKTGIIAGPVTVLTNLNFPYGAEFSPRGRYLYISENLGRRIFQYDLGAANINASQVMIQPPNLNYGALQLGPDGKIYVAAENDYNVGYSFLGRIENPDAAGAACNFVPNAVNLGIGRTLIGLPTLASDYFINDSIIINHPSFCKGVSGSFSFANINNVDSVKWNFGDGTPNSNELAPVHTYSNANTYQVQLILYKSCNKNDTINKPVKVTDCTINCNTWLATPSYISSVSVGDLDIVGNQLTVEALFVNSSAFNSSPHEGKIVSKHTGTSNVNYSLMSFTAEITTTNGYVNTPPVCMPLKDKVYHVAMVYNGTELKFYRNGYLMSSIPWTGNLVNNDLLTTIACGPNAPGSTYQHYGYVNEVRIWNVARTQAQLVANMNSALPEPATQTGLQGYYRFDNLVNKQGNANYNGSIIGLAAIGQTNENCTFLNDSCGVVIPVTLTAFAAKVTDNKQVALSWETAEEQGLQAYVLERSVNANGGFTAIATLQPHNISGSRYAFTDYNVQPNVLYYYRLRIKELTGQVKFSAVRIAKITGQDITALVYPNPTHQQLHIQLAGHQGRATVTVIDNIGRRLLQRVFANANGPLPLDVSRLAAGSYQLLIETDTDKIVKHWVKLGL